MALTLYYHPLSSCCHKVLIALYELGLPFQPRFLDLGDAREREAFLRIAPMGRMPVLVDDGRPLPETSIIIEHLQSRAGDDAARLLPSDPADALQARLWDRLLDLYVMTPMQALVAQRRRPEHSRDADAAARAHDTLATAYAMLDRHMQGRTWAGGKAFGLADCAAAPALFYAATLQPFAGGQAALAAYFERLVARPSVARVLDEARPYFHLYPGRDGIPARFLGAAHA